MKIAAARDSFAAAYFVIVALTRGEAWLLRGTILLFALTVAFCVWVLLKVQDAEAAANQANDHATDLARRTAALERQIADRG